jgi:hypothetical protein
VSVDVHQTCPHCRAIVQSTICTICGKSAFAEVAAPPAPEKQKWTDTLKNNELKKVGFGVLALLVLIAGVAFVLTRPESTATATALPPPASTTTAKPTSTPTEAAPSVVGGVKPATGFVPGAPREVGEGLSPWETPLPVDFVTGLLLDESLDFATDIDRVGELLRAFPPVLTLAPLDPPELLTLDGTLDAEQIETTQPFAARTLTRNEGEAVGELWLIASGGSTPGNAYLAAARNRWNSEAALDNHSPEVGVRLWLLGADTTKNLWVGDLKNDSMVVIQAPLSVHPSVLTDVLKAWRRLAS